MKPHALEGAVFRVVGSECPLCGDTVCVTCHTVDPSTAALGLRCEQPLCLFVVEVAKVPDPRRGRGRVPALSAIERAFKKAMRERVERKPRQ